MSGSENPGRDGRNEPTAPKALPHRSPSAATKRSAADMGGVDIRIQTEDVDMNPSQTTSSLPERMSNNDRGYRDSPNGSQEPQSQTRHKRGVSVDMIGSGSNADGETAAAAFGSATYASPYMDGSRTVPRDGTSSSTINSPIDVDEPAGHETEIPSVDEQIAQVRKLAQGMQEGQKGYVLSQKWLSRVLSRGSDAREKDRYGKEAKEGDIGPVDNTGINMIQDPSSTGFMDEAGEPFIPLKPGLQMNEDFEVLPKPAWDLIIKWYNIAKGSPIITRYVHNTSTGSIENLQYELHPPVFTVLKLPDRSAGGMTQQALREKDAPPVRVLASRHESFQKFLSRIKTMVGIDMKTRVRIWRILGGLRENVGQSGMITPARSRTASPPPNVVTPVDPGSRLVLDVNTFLGLQKDSQREPVEARDETTNEKYNDHANLDIVGLSRDDVIVLEEQIGGPAGGEWVSDALGKHLLKNGVSVSVTKNGTTTSQDTLKPRAAVGSGRTSPAPFSGGIMTRGRQLRNGKTRGTVGLSNLGNTCYMNSALQCVRSVQELTQYFLLNKHKRELNPSNPLSHGGNVAKYYSSLLNEIHNDSASSSLAPRAFKNIIGKYGPSFSGYGQQDSQEFLLFLLDGLQEDLNRITKKPYIEKPDSTDEMVNDPIALNQMANKCWDIYKARNDSVITDLFAGMYKSTVVCPICDKVSIIFDPFNNLTLQLPIEDVWSKLVDFFPLHSRPVKVRVEIDKNANFGALKDFICKRVKVDPKRIIVGEIYKNKMYKMFSDDNASIADERIADNDEIALYEVEDIPTNYPPPKKKVQKMRMMYSTYNSEEEEDLPRADSPMAEKMLVPVFHRQPKDGSMRYAQRQLFGVPFYVIITREEAKDLDAILRKVLAKVATMTTKDILRDDSVFDSESGVPEDSDTVLMTTDDADSSSDSKVQANSLTSEDGMVDISMKDTGEDCPALPYIANPPKSSQNHHTPAMLQAGSFILPEVRSLFEMKYFSSTNMIPTGWSNLHDENKDYPTIASRVPRHPEQPRSSLKVTNPGGSDSPGSSDEDVEDVMLPVSSFTPINDYSDSDSDGLPTVEALMQPRQSLPGFSRFNRNTQRTKKGLITYSRKGKLAAANIDKDGVEIEPGSDPGPLIRLGEAIILDWNSHACDALFGGTESKYSDSMRGAPTWDAKPQKADPELDMKRSLRASRKRNGVSLGDCLDEFGKAEVLSENDAWYCPRCKEHRRASKTFELWKSPDILVIHLKRFSAQGRLRDKLDLFVDFPVEGLDLSSRVAMQEDGKSPIYDLFAVDNHYGGLGGGHYTAFAKNFLDSTWYEYNDSSVTRRSNSQMVVTAAAYLLFYRRRSSRPLGGPFFEQILNAASNADSPSASDSRATSPSGEGRRLGDSSRNGSSSALQGVGAAHQLGDGGLSGGTPVTNGTSIVETLPEYSAGLPRGEQSLIAPGQETLESMELEEEDGIDGMHSRAHSAPYPAPKWSFSNVDHPYHDLAGEEADEEDLFDGVSNRAASSGGLSDEGRMMSDFTPDEGTTHGAFGTPNSRENTPIQEEPPPLLEEEEDDTPVADIHVSDGEEMFRMEGA